MDQRLTRRRNAAALSRPTWRVGVTACGCDADEDNNSATLVFDLDLVSRAIDHSRQPSDPRPSGSYVRQGNGVRSDDGRIVPQHLEMVALHHQSKPGEGCTKAIRRSALYPGAVAIV